MNWYSDEPTMSFARPAHFAVRVASLAGQVAPARRYDDNSSYGARSYGAGESRSMKNPIRSSGARRACVASRDRLNRWFEASIEAKFIRASMVPVENHSWPSDQPATSGG